MDTSYERQLQDQLAQYGISCADEQAALLLHHLDLVIEKNKVVNLTRITNKEEAISLHVVDSLLPLACADVSMGTTTCFVDMGTGAGFPGIPLGVMTGASGLLVDSVGKKVAAVSEFLGELGLVSLTAIHTRVEDVRHEVLGHQDYVFARAVAQTNVLIEYATPLLSQGGCLVLEKARPDENELACAERAAKLCGLTSVSRETFELPYERGHREILIYQKTGRPKVKLPRRAGMAKQTPLGA